MSNNHLQTSKTALAHVLLAYKTPNPFLSSLSRKKGVLADIYGGYLNADPVDVALVSPQTPLTPRIHPLLAGGCCRQHPYKATLLSSLQWVFCVFTCNHPPQQTLLPEPSALPSSQAFREEGPINRSIRGLAWNLIRRMLHLCLRKLPWFHQIIPFLQADIASHILVKLSCLRTFSGFFASSLAIIHLNKLSTLSLRDIPPLKPFERRDKPTDIHGGF